ncbi:hypothetical protein [Tropicimonas isoalkanivorans]|uniref:Phage tail tube protein n=1 Tax=Tropicimonas isoalkanivorans TaxID=441112 RepID=A0A1I1E599_9RHOB|nr:hypothetical protein [Tropicimonas isoalkanivorans]SFB82341.1 hypothetical protein SAMN04488094_101648 [Tropicimonas isoalkanivorans]
MIYSTAGSRIFIADLPDGPIPAAGWVEIGETETLGTLGVEWQMDEATVACDPDGPQEVEFAKSALRRQAMQIVLGNDLTDAGQVVLWKAAYSSSDFPFRLVLPDGVTERAWMGFVMRIGEVFGEADVVMRLEVDIQPNGAIQRSEDT